MDLFALVLHDGAQMEKKLSVSLLFQNGLKIDLQVDSRSYVKAFEGTVFYSTEQEAPSISSKSTTVQTPKY